MFLIFLCLFRSFIWNLMIAFWKFSPNWFLGSLRWSQRSCPYPERVLASEESSDPQGVWRSTGEVWLKHLCPCLSAEVFEITAFWWTNTESPACATGVQLIVSFNFHQRTASVIIISVLRMKDWDQQRWRDFVETTQLLRGRGKASLVQLAWCSFSMWQPDQKYHRAGMVTGKQPARGSILYQVAICYINEPRQGPSSLATGHQHWQAFTAE